MATADLIFSMVDELKQLVLQPEYQNCQHYLDTAISNLTEYGNCVVDIDGTKQS